MPAIASDPRGLNRPLTEDEKTIADEATRLLCLAWEVRKQVAAQHEIGVELGDALKAVEVASAPLVVQSAPVLTADKATVYVVR